MARTQVAEHSSEAGYAAAAGMPPWQPDESAPVWHRAIDEHVVTSEGRELVDMVMGHGACLWGHGYVTGRVLERYGPEVLAQGIGSQASTELRERALGQLCRWAARSWPSAEPIQVGILHTGAEAVEAAVRTAISATGRPRGVAFENAYHGSFGLAAACSWNGDPDGRFTSLLRQDAVRHVPFGEVPQLDERDAFVIVEPVQGSSGATCAPDGFLTELREACTQAGTMLILDDVLVGAGRTGAMLEGAHVDPDIVTLAKAIGGGMIASALLTRRGIAAAAWGGDDAPSLGTTYYAHPFTCAAILEVIDLLDRSDLAALCRPFDEAMATVTDRTGLTRRGRGAMQALITQPGGGPALAERLLAAGFLTSPSGAEDEAVLFTPSLRMAQGSLDEFVEAACGAAR